MITNVKYGPPKYLLIIFIFLFPSCISLQPDQIKVNRAIERFTDTTVYCHPSPTTPCFANSPFGELVERAFSSRSGSSPHFINLLEFGDDAFVARAHLIRSAKKTIYIQTFIWGKDESSRFFNRELLKAARRGVKVKVLVDQLGLLGKGPRLEFGAIAHSNLEIKVYNPTLNKAHSNFLEMAEAALFNFGDFNQRMHNKVMIIDKQIAITGGRNFENKYFDLDPTYNFKDRDVLVIGDVVHDMNQSFIEYWNYNESVALKYLTDVGRKIIGLTNNEPVLELLHSKVIPKLSELDRKASDYKYIRNTFTSKAYEVNGRVVFLSDPPGKREEDDNHRSLLITENWERISQYAKKSVIIQTPYLCFSKVALEKLEELREQHPDLKIIASTNSLASTDNYATYAISYRQKKHLLKNLNVEIYELKPVPGDVHQMIHGYKRLAEEKESRIEELTAGSSKGPKVGIHGKAFVLDNEIVWIGSHNFDPRSDNINTEVALVIWDKEVAVKLKNEILRDSEPQNSWFVAKRRKLPIIEIFSGLLESISIALPILDIWPFYYFTNYELLPGRQPVPLDHPEFDENYENVGPFPGLNISIKAIKTRLIKTMGKIATPII